eukprot:TRINITY_DN2042_c0_g1_i3.p1 TRINITY_DN2042_c0_g1~~TRINITY_DN2042_c0_g1_i3.p1  ORF type:complete len:307 (+),score=40.25 TRINITY_DN2042_c0_g1_i3:124-1044(+)
MVDFGLPTITELNNLTEMITVPSPIVVPGVPKPPALICNVPDSLSTVTPWRKSRVEYPSNDIFFDIIEEIDCILESDEQLVQTVCSKVHGTVIVNCKLSGFPEITVFFENQSLLEDVSLHPCVNANRYLREKVISFIPPDGVFELMTYRANVPLNIPIHVHTGASLDQGLKVEVLPRNPKDKPLHNVMLWFILPKDLNSGGMSATHGSVNYDYKTKECQWDIGKLSHSKKYALTGALSIRSDEAGRQVVAGPILILNFQIVNFSSTGIRIESIMVSNVNYRPYKGVRLITRSGTFEIRTPFLRRLK